MAISTVPDPSGSGRVDMLTSTVAAARAAVETGAWVKSKRHVSDTWKCGSLSFIFTHSPEDKKKEKEKEEEKEKENVVVQVFRLYIR